MEGKEPDRSARPGGARAVAAGMAPFRAGFGRADWAVRLEAWRAGLGQALERETERRTWFNLLPLAFALGVGAYFLADREPLRWGPPLAFALLAASAFAARARPLALAVLTALAAAAAGLWAADLRTDRVAGPQLSRTAIGPLSGYVESVEERTDDVRLVLRVTGFAGWATKDLPRRVRVTARKATVEPGAHVTFPPG